MSSDAHMPPGNDVAICTSNLSKHFRIYERPFHRLKEAFFLDRRSYHSVVHALSDVSFTVRPGESVGLMGHNGAGKTSLLSILAGTLAPTTGTVDVYGRVGAILALGVGFLAQYTGRENVRNGLIARGVPREQLTAKEAEVIEFTELGEAIDNPIRTYSSGMNMRLGFALAISIDPDILIVDEALAVGDAAFQHKCQTAIRTFMERGKTLFFVSHNTALLEAVCDRGIVLDRGRVVCDGPIREAIQQMRLRFFGLEPEGTDSTSERDWGDPQAALVRAAVRDARPVRDNVYEVHQGELVRVALTVRTPTRIERPAIGVLVRNALGVEVCGCSTVSSREPMPPIEAGEFSFEVRLHLNVQPGIYTFRIGVSDVAAHPPHLVHAWEDVVAVQVLSVGYVILGMIDPGIEIEYRGHVCSLLGESERRRASRPRDGEA